MDVSDIFYFFCSGEGHGESEAPEMGGGGSVFLLKIPGGGGSPRRSGGEPKGRDFFFSGPKFGGFWGGFFALDLRVASLHTEASPKHRTKCDTKPVQESLCPLLLFRNFSLTLSQKSETH